MKLNKNHFVTIVLGCMMLLWSNIALANGGNYQATDDFARKVLQNPIDAAYQKEIDAASTTLQYRLLEEMYIKIWDKELNVVYQKLLAKLSESQRASLIDSQVNWLNWHTQESKFVYMTWLDDRKLGSWGPA